MTVKYKTVITKAGAEKLAAATVPNGKKVNFTAMAVGDGGGALPVHLEFGGCEVPVFADGQDNAQDEHDNEGAEDNVPEGEDEAYGEEDAEPFEEFHGCSFAIRRCICE